MLHLHNGDAAADIARQSSIPAEHFAFREALIEGPTPAGFEGTTWRIIRVRHLALAYGIDFKECAQELTAQEMKLASFEQHDEVVLWFEHDLFCQLHLLYLLNWFSSRDLGETKLTLICIGEFPGKENFRGLGELTSEELASLFPKRQQVTPDQLNLAASGWQAYCAANPTQLEAFLQTDSSALPFLNTALRAHLERFPSTRNGLGRIENSALRLIQSGMNSFSNLFAKVGETESIYGFGDAQFWHTLLRMTRVQQPLLTITNGANGNPDRQVLTPEVVHKARLELTEVGNTILNSAADYVGINGIDQWLGGVHLLGAKTWRWDEQTSSLVSGHLTS